jgi:hypothetical protein
MTVRDEAPGRFRNTNAKARKREEEGSSSRLSLRFRAFAFVLDLMGWRGIVHGHLATALEPTDVHPGLRVMNRRLTLHIDWK